MKSFTLHKPIKKELAPIILTSPHSGNKYTNEFLKYTNYNYDAYNSLEDKYVDQLYSDSIDYGIMKIDAIYSRAVIDLNRSLYDLDPNLINNIPYQELNSNSYVDSGIGLIPKVDLSHNAIYAEKIPWKYASRRIDNIYKKWHECLQKNINNHLSLFNRLILLDCHSMPPFRDDNKKYDFVLGNNFGKSCDKSLINFIKEELSAMGYSVGCNYPYSGGFITSYYSNLEKKIDTLQIEVDRDLYMCSKSYKKTFGFNNLKKNLNSLLYKVSDFSIKNQRKNFAAE